MGTRTRVLQRIGAPFSAAAVAAFLSVTGYALAAGTTSGTVISNTATASYSDGTNTYSSTSNTVTTTVAPISAETVLLVSSVPGNTTFGTGVTTSNAVNDGTVVTPQNTITDTYVVSNTGNTTAVVTLTSAGYGIGGTNNNTASGITATSPAADTSATAGVYQAYNCTSAQTNAQCIAAASTTQVGGGGTTYTSEANLSTAVAGVTVAQGGYVLVQFNYNVGTGFSGTNSTVPDGSSPITETGTTTTGGSGLQIPTGITATDKSTGATNSSAAASATFFDQELSDGRIDVLKVVGSPATGTAPIQYTIDGNNGGGNNAKAVDLTTVLGTGACSTAYTCIGYAVSDVIQPATNSNVAKVYNNLTGAGEPTSPITTTCPASNPVATVFYATSTTPAAGAFTKVVVGTTNIESARLLVLVCSNTATTSQANAPALPPNPTSSGYGGYGFTDGSGGTNLPTMPGSPQIVLGFYTSQATVVANGVTQPNEANSLAQNNAPTSELIGPGTNSGVTPATAGSTGEIAMLDNVTPQPSNGTNAPSSGYSNTTTTSLVYLTIGFGPYNAPDAIGAFSTATPPTSAGGENGFWGTNPAGSTSNNNDFTVAAILGTQSGGAYPAANGTSTTPSTLTGASSVLIAHTIKNEGNTTDGYTVSAVQTATANAVQTPGNATYTVTYYDYSGGACQATSTTINNTTGATSATAVAAGATFSFCVKYTPTGTVDTFDQKAFQLTATSQNTATVKNATYDLLIAGGYIQMSKTVAVSGTAADGGTCSTTNAEPGCVLTYTVAWTNTLPVANAGTGATGNVVPSISGFTITEDGISNGWYNISSPTTSSTTGILTAATITGDASGQVAYYKTASATYAKGGSCYPNTTAATAVSQSGCSTNASAASGGSITGPFGALVYVYGNSTTATVTNATSGTISFPLIIRATP